MTSHKVAEVLTEVYGYLFQIHRCAKDGGADSRFVDLKVMASDAMHRVDMLSKQLAEELTNGEERV